MVPISRSAGDDPMHYFRQLREHGDRQAVTLGNDPDRGR
jgi:hypothetical protein